MKKKISVLMAVLMLLALVLNGLCRQWYERADGQRLAG